GASRPCPSPWRRRLYPCRNRLWPWLPAWAFPRPSPWPRRLRAWASLSFLLSRRPSAHSRDRFAAPRAVALALAILAPLHGHADAHLALGAEMHHVGDMDRGLT